MSKVRRTDNLKRNNVKGVRVGLRKDTIIAKLKDKGVDNKKVKIDNFG